MIWPFGRSESKPTPKQMSYLKDLCKTLGVKVPKVRTKAEAGAAIDVAKAAIDRKADAVRR